MARGAYGEIKRAELAVFKKVEQDYGVTLPTNSCDGNREIRRLGIFNPVTGEWADPATYRREHGGTEAGDASNDAPSQL